VTYPRPFERQEYLLRLHNTKQEMTKRGFDVAVIVDPSNIYYLTGYSGLSSYVPQALLVIVDEEEPLFVTRMMDINCALHTAFVAEDRLIGYPETFIGNEDENGIDYLLQTMRSRGLLKRRIAAEIASNFFSVPTWQKFQAADTTQTIADCSRMVTWLRMSKTESEIAFMRQAGQIADSAIKATVDAVRPGVRQCDVGAAVLAAQARGLPDFGGDQVIQPNWGVGPTTDSPHLTWSDAPLERGQSVTIELGGSRFRYVCGVSRTLHLGKPPQALRDVHEITAEGMAAAEAVARPGRTCGDVWDAFEAVIAPSGFKKTSRLGYSIGIDWLEPTASFHKGSTTVLLSNMTFHMICGMWEQDGWGYVLSNTFLVGPDRTEVLTNAPRDLFVID
jgi:ectoine hydrolase